MSHLFNIPQEASPSQQGSIPGASSPSAPTAPGPSPRPKWQHCSPDPMGISPLSEATSKATPKGPPSLKLQEDNASSQGVDEKLSRGIWPWDSQLVRKTREEYFRNHCPNLNNENTHDLMDIFWHMIETAGLLGSTIYEIQEAWTGWDELQHANYALRTLQKGLKFLLSNILLRVPKGNGVNGHTPSWCTMHCFNGVTHCPWCGKEGQKEDTIINHLRAVHYKFVLHIQEMFPLSVQSHHVVGHLAPWLEELPTFSGGRSQWVILFGITTIMKYARSTFPRWKPG